MNNSEIKEIRSLYNIKDCPINAICGCYVNGTKDIVTTWREKFLAQDEETMYKYLNILKGSLSGAKDKTLFDISPRESWRTAIQDIKTGGLTVNKDMPYGLFNSVIDAYDHTGSYVILLFHGVYDIPGKSTDGTTIEDASEEVYDYIQMCICPVKPSKPGLAYDKESNRFTHSPIMQEIGKPDVSLMYPAFNDRSEDRDEALLFARNLDEDKKKFLELFTGFTISLKPDEQSDAFRRIVNRVLGHGKTIKNIKDLEQEICIRAADMQSDGDNMIGPDEIRELLESCDVAPEKVDSLDRIYAEELGSKDKKLSFGNIINRNGISIKTMDGITIKSKTITSADITEAVSDDGKPGLLMYLNDGDIVVNGLEVHIV